MSRYPACDFRIPTRPVPFLNQLESDLRRILSIGEECISEVELKALILAKGRGSGASSSVDVDVLSHHMLYGLKEGQEKMSKSDPDSAIFMEDAAEDVKRKIRSAYCPTSIPSVVGGGGAQGDGEEGDAGKESMHLVNDDDSILKNPILDYVRHIVLSPPGSTFACCRGEGQDKECIIYNKYDNVKSDFLAGSISPDQLKDGLIVALNELLQPVRDHFETDVNARGLLEQVREFKREMTPAAPDVTNVEAPKVFRLDLVEAGIVPASCHLVMAPLPETNPTLQSVADVLAMLKGGVDVDSTKPRVLLLPDWTARVNGSLDADPKLIAAYHAVLLRMQNK